MKGLNFYDKFIFVVNSAAAAVLLIAYILPYLAPKSFGLLSVLSLTVPFLIILNLLFFLYWLLRVKKQLVLSLVVLLIGYKYISSLYKFSASDTSAVESELALMSYNVRLFNVYNWIDEDNIGEQIMTFIHDENPDIVCFQEFHPDEQVKSDTYPYKFEELSGTRMRYGQAIWSKYPFVNKGSIAFQNTANNAIFADVVNGQDTIRIYNVHLQSSGIKADIEPLEKTNSRRLIRRVANTFRMQQEQAGQVIEHMKTSPYKTVVCGDFNNTAYSYVYRQIKGDLNDTFEAAGQGFGRTFTFKYFPVRIDFILADPVFRINGFKTFNVNLSDHYPILSSLSLGE
ncbi:MAG: endonuclease/exonuclease/phosphatase family protein [Flavobacteriaceae bacterium]|nr:endonuclease/exonuclease/phosphatase family protein [Flavobacteriaceae bacterium]